MNNGQEEVRSPYRADRVPPFLAPLDSINEKQAVRVFKYERGGLKRDAMLALVALVLNVITLKCHCINYTDFPYRGQCGWRGTCLKNSRSSPEGNWTEISKRKRGEELGRYDWVRAGVPMVKYSAEGRNRNLGKA